MHYAHFSYCFYYHFYWQIMDWFISFENKQLKICLKKAKFLSDLGNLFKIKNNKALSYLQCKDNLVFNLPRHVKLSKLFKFFTTMGHGSSILAQASPKGILWPLKEPTEPRYCHSEFFNDLQEKSFACDQLKPSRFTTGIFSTRFKK